MASSRGGTKVWPGEIRLGLRIGSWSAFSDVQIAAVPRLRRVALLRAGSAAEADDMVQANLSKALEHRSSVRAGTNLAAWLFTILRIA